MRRHAKLASGCIDCAADHGGSARKRGEAWLLKAIGLGRTAPGPIWGHSGRFMAGCCQKVRIRLEVISTLKSSAWRPPGLRICPTDPVRQRHAASPCAATIVERGVHRVVAGVAWPTLPALNWLRSRGVEVKLIPLPRDNSTEVEGALPGCNARNRRTRSWRTCSREAW